MAEIPSTLNRVQFSGLDFLTHTDELLARLQAQFGLDFNNFVLSDLGIVLLDAHAYGLDTLSFYLDRRATDQYLATARTRRSVAYKARQLGYKMRAAIAGSTDLRVQINVAYAFAITIPVGFKFQGPNGLIFEVAQAVTWAPVDTGPASAAKIVPVYEGETFTDSFTSAGTANQVFELTRADDGRFIASGTAKVTVNGGAWEEQEFLTFFPTDQYEVGYNDSPPTIRFGNNTTGNIPVAGASIVTTYIVTHGKAGLIGRNVITAPVTPLVVMFQPISLVVSQPDPSTGADDPEELERAKVYAAAVAKGRDVAVTGEDYLAYANSYADPTAGRVAVAVAVSPRTAASDATLQASIAQILSLVSVPNVVVAAEVTAAKTALAAILSELTDLQSVFTSMGTDLTTANTELASATTDNNSAKVKTQESITYAGDVISNTTTAKATIQAIPTALVDSLLAATKSALIAQLDAAVSKATLMSGNFASILASLTSISGRLGVLLDLVAGLGLTPLPPSLTGPQLQQAEAHRQKIGTIVGTEVPSTGIYANLDAIDTVVTDTLADVTVQTDALYNHVDALLSADCKANLVEVPILVHDAAGFYQPPSSALVQSLQAALDARKEVTQTVKVTSGAYFLVPAVLTVRLVVQQGFSVRVVQAAVAAVIDAQLRDRSFGSDLYLDALYTAIRALDGINFVNVTINGHLDGALLTAAKLDGSGNLIVDEDEVVTKGTVTFSPDPPEQRA